MTSVKKWLGAVAVGLLATVGSVQAAESVTYYYTSPQGTVLATADAAGNVLSTADYRPYGAQALGAPVPGPGYTGHVNDVDSGLTYMQARYYDPNSGRFLSVDPEEAGAGDAFAFGRYSYGGLNPVVNIDPDGRQSCVPEGCTVGPTPYNWFRDDVVGRLIGHTVGDPIALARPDSLNPLTSQTLDGAQLQEAKLGILTLAIPVSRTEKVAADVAKEVLAPAIKAGSSGGATAGKAFPEAVKEMARAENPGKICVYCSMKGTATQVDHAVPRARGGNATIENAQMTCPHCNQSKGAGDFPKSPPPGYTGNWPPEHW